MRFKNVIIILVLSFTGTGNLIAQNVLPTLTLTNDYDQLRFHVPGENRYWIFSKTVGNNNKAFALYSPEDGGYFTYWNAGSGDLIMKKGSLGIGEENPTAKLHLNGDMKVPFTWKLTESSYQNNIIEAGWTSGVGDFIAIKHGGNNNDEGTYGLRIGDGQGFEFGKNNFNESFLTIDKTGIVGIGTNSPSARLTIAGNEVNKPSIIIRNNSYRSTDSEGTASLQFAFENHKGPKIEASKITTNTTALNLYTEYGFNNPQLGMSINPGSEGSRVGIGTTAPQAKLHVNGNILAAEVTVSTAATEVPDYVFKEDYKLTSLTDLEKYIKENHHLPEIPSAKEVEAEGLDLAKMNLLLLKKIEELTLHTIQLEKENNVMKENFQRKFEAMQLQIESNKKAIINR